MLRDVMAPLAPVGGRRLVRASERDLAAYREREAARVRVDGRGQLWLRCVVCGGPAFDCRCVRNDLSAGALK